MKTTYPNTYTSFMGHRRIASGPMLTNVLAVKKVLESRVNDPVLIFDDVTGRFVDVNTQGTDEELAQRYAPVDAPEVEVEQTEEEAPRGRGRRAALGVQRRRRETDPRGTSAAGWVLRAENGQKAIERGTLRPPAVIVRT